jgi:hypothetical protein
MVRNRSSNDKDFVPPTQYPKLPKGKKKLRPPDPKPIPPFDPLPIRDYTQYRRPNIPEQIDRGDPFAIFRLFFTNKLLDRLVEHTNRNAELNPTPEER